MWRRRSRAELGCVLAIIALSVPPHVAGQDEAQSLLACPMEVSCPLPFLFLPCRTLTVANEASRHCRLKSRGRTRRR